MEQRAENPIDNKEKIRAIGALMKAYSAFKHSLQVSGYSLDYPLNLDDTHTGYLRKSGVPTEENWPLGTVTIKWEMRN